MTNAAHTNALQKYGISSCVFQSRAPFHPGRLANWLRANGWDVGPHNATHAAAAAAACNHNTASPAAGTAVTTACASQLHVHVLRSKGFFWVASAHQVLLRRADSLRLPSACLATWHMHEIMY
jgi:G3E family GTPase